MGFSGKTVTLKSILQGTNDNSGASKVEGVERYQVQALFSGSGTGQIKLQISVDGINFSDYPSSQFAYPPAGNNNIQWEVRDVGHAFVRVQTISGASPNGNIDILMFQKILN